jgi:peptidoglycan-associated lipoprotein
MKRLLAITLIAVATLAGCAATPEDETAGAPVEDRKPGATGPTTSPVTPPGGTGTAIDDPNRDPRLKDPSNILSKRSVYFDFDSDAIKPEFVPIVEAHARFLRDNPRARMLIQGNADERGSREYNIGLGQRRADAIKSRLVLLGAQASQIESASLGEEKPRCTEQTEACWAQNRRADMLYGFEL